MMSGLAVVQKRSEEREYCFHVFLMQKSMTIYRIDCALTWNTQAHLQDIKKELEKGGAQLVFDQVMEFEYDRIIADVPMDGIDCLGGWRLLPLAPPTILKKTVDSWEPGKVIPKVSFSISHITEEEKPPPFKHQLKLMGARPPHDCINLCIDPFATDTLGSGPGGVKKLRLDHESTMLMTSEYGLQGVEVLQKTTVAITNSESTFVWEGYGLKLHIPENCLPSDVKQVTLTILASIAGHYNLPENSSLISGVYWFCYELLSCKLKKPVVLEIQHCAKPESASNLSFVRSSSNQNKLPYTFKHLEGGKFTSHSSYGILTADKFCGIAIVGPPNAKGYIASLFYLKHETVSWDIRFVVTLNTKLHRKASEKEFSKKADTEVKIEFKSDEITLDIPLDGTKVLEGWKLYPNAHPMVTKGMVDNFLPGRWIPQCQIFADLMDPSRASGRHLHHRVSLQGAKAPFDSVTITLSHGGASIPPRQSLDPNVDNARDFLDVDSSSILGVDDLLRIMREVTSRRSSYYALGRGLGLPVSDLESIRRQYESIDLDQALNEVLLKWLRQHHNTEDLGNPTWQMLVRAIADPGGLNDCALAREIASRHSSARQ